VCKNTTICEQTLSDITTIYADFDEPAQQPQQEEQAEEQHDISPILPLDPLPSKNSEQCVHTYELVYVHML